MKIESLYKKGHHINPAASFVESVQLSASAFRLDAQKDRLAFWHDQAEKLHWYEPWKTVLEWKKPFAQWFKQGKLNACYNCVDRHIKSGKQHKSAVVWQGEQGEKQTYTYQQLHQEVCQFANILINQCHVKKGDRVTLYMPLIP